MESPEYWAALAKAWPNHHVTDPSIEVLGQVRIMGDQRIVMLFWNTGNDMYVMYHQSTPTTYYVTFLEDVVQAFDLWMEIASATLAVYTTEIGNQV